MNPATQKQIASGRRALDEYFSVAILAEGLPCLVVGGGRVGARKAANLLAAGARVTVLSPEILPRLENLAEQRRIEWRQAEYNPWQLDGFHFVVAATADRRLNLDIGQDAEDRGILSCVVSSAASSRVIFPAVWSDGNVTVAVHSQGWSCRQSQAVRNRIATWLSESRQPCKNFQEPARDGPVWPSGHSARLKTSTAMGKVYVLGAGPGASDLISLRGYQALPLADAILIDQLVPATFLEDLGIFSTGKLVKHLGNEEPHWTQEEINQWLVATARTGRTVARLKGGDPMIFGRGDHEIECLASHDVPWEVIPGLSSATAVLTAAGFPLTKHGQGRSFAVATARMEGGRVTTSFPRTDSLVILMGISVLDQVVARLLGQGWPPDTTAAIVERGTLNWERRISGPLCQLRERAVHAGVASPALVVVGKAAETIAAVRHRPTILFSGLDPTNFRAMGNILHWPAQAMVSNPEGQGQLSRGLGALNRRQVDWIVFSDKFAVKTFWAALTDQRLDARILHGVRIVALGTTTARQLAQHHCCADVVIREEDSPKKHLARPGTATHKCVLMVQGSHTPHGLGQELEKIGATVMNLALRRLVPHPELGRPLPDHDVIYFVSPAGVHAYAKVYGLVAFQREVWCLGEATQRALTEYGVAAKVVRPETPHVWPTGFTTNTCCR